MRLGRLVGRAILAGVDALAAGVTLAVALALAGLGRRPLPATRPVRAAVRRLPGWV